MNNELLNGSQVFKRTCFMCVPYHWKLSLYGELIWGTICIANTPSIPTICSCGLQNGQGFSCIFFSQLFMIVVNTGCSIVLWDVNWRGHVNTVFEAQPCTHNLRILKMTKCI